MSPYIKLARRVDIDNGKNPENAGELNYKIISEIKKYLSYLNYKKIVEGKKDEKGFVGTANNYKDYNEVIGVLECVKQELYRRLIAPYEDKKKDENGDVF